MISSFTDLQTLEKKINEKSPPTDVARLEYLRRRCKAAGEKIRGEIDRFHEYKEQDFPNVMRVFVAIMSDHTHRNLAIFQSV